MPDFFSQVDWGFWILQTAAMMLTCFLLPKLEVSGPLPAFLTVLALAFVNAHFWDAALFLKLPDSLTVQTALLVLTNAVIFFIVVKLLPGIDIRGVFPALLAPILFTFVSALLREHAKDVDWLGFINASLDLLKGWRERFQTTQVR